MLILSKITPRDFKNYYINKNLGILSIEIPEIGTITIFLERLYEELLCPKGYEKDHQIEIENIKAIVLYGSILYKHFYPKVKNRKKWIFFGPNLVTLKKRVPPNDVDIMILLKNKLKNMKDNIVIAKVHKTRHGYGPYDARIDSSIEFSSSSTNMQDGIKLHIAYRTCEQFINGINKGDSVGTFVFRYGVPFIGKEYFLQIIKNITEIKRQPLHNLHWSYDEENNKINGSLVDYIENKEIFLRKNRFQLIDI